MKLTKKKTKKYRELFKKSPEEVAEYQAFRRKFSVRPSKKGKGSFKRKPKHTNYEE